MSFGAAAGVRSLANHRSGPVSSKVTRLAESALPAGAGAKKTSSPALDHGSAFDIHHFGQTDLLRFLQERVGAVLPYKPQLGFGLAPRLPHWAVAHARGDHYMIGPLGRGTEYGRIVSFRSGAGPVRTATVGRNGCKAPLFILPFECFAYFRGCFIPFAETLAGCTLRSAAATNQPPTPPITATRVPYGPRIGSTRFEPVMGMGFFVSRSITFAGGRKPNRLRSSVNVT